MKPLNEQDWENIIEALDYYVNHVEDDTKSFSTTLKKVDDAYEENEE